MLSRMPRDAARPLEMWGGVEASVVRIGDEYVDQLRLGGHDERCADLDAFAALGIKAIRYPVLWERVAPGALDEADWSWPEARLGRLRELGVRPIAGLLHHGNGPRHTELAAPDFPAKFAAYAAAVAQRFPWLDAYTPVNEPLTTARFCGLYGHWYPHGRDVRTFARLLVNQIHATRLAMRAIRAVNPAAQLVQTEDLGKAHSTPRLAYQAEFENERRWLTFDLLAGRVDRAHPLWDYLAAAGVERDLEAILADPCPPDILGIDHYLTSERFLDERVERYPEWARAHNGREAYADIEAIRVVAEGVRGFERLAGDAWERYGIPLACTEAHNACTREEQLRWLKEVWDGAQRLRTQGVDVRGVTAWALLGAHDWNSLMTRRVGFYESGVFDLRGAGRPRPTALARMVKELATSGDADHPALDAPGWWHREDRFTYPPVRSCPYTIATRIWTPPKGRARPRTLLVTGGEGVLARAVARHCAMRGLPYRLLTRRELDIADPRAVAAAIDRHRPWAIVNAAGYSHVARAEAEAERCWRDNVVGADVLARACRSAGLRLLSFSSHLVFDGGKRAPYLESDAVGPVGVYATSKAEGERAVLGACPEALVVRAGALFGPGDGRDVLARVLQRLSVGLGVAAAEATLSPSYVPDLLAAALDLLIDEESGIWHLANTGPVTWAEFARAAAERVGLSPAGVRPVGAEASPATRRPLYSALGSARAVLMPSLESALGRYVGAWAADGAPWLQPGDAAEALPAAVGWG
jgi:dTDP-4-dehydrorhamnose reductase